MPRINRVDVGDYCYHIINRANARMPIFFDENDFRLFVNVLEEGREFNVRVLAYCLMPNHFHLVLYPYHNGDLGKFMQWITLTHTQRWHQIKNTKGTGHLYQGRYKSFIVKEDSHLLSVVRYVERNPLRAKLVKKAENWNFSSLSHRLLKGRNQKLLSEWPIPIPEDYLSFVNTPLTEEEEELIKLSIVKGRPYGGRDWTAKVIDKFNLGSTIRSQGRPKKGT